MDILFPYVTIEQEYGKKDRKSNYEKTTKLCRYHKGSADPDRCGSDHCGSSLFLPGAEPYLGQQHFRYWHRAVKFRAAAAVDDHDDFERRPAADRLSHLRAGIRSEDRLYERDAAGVSGAF